MSHKISFSRISSMMFFMNSAVRMVQTKAMRINIIEEKSRAVAEAENKLLSSGYRTIDKDLKQFFKAERNSGPSAGRK